MIDYRDSDSIHFLAFIYKEKGISSAFCFRKEAFHSIFTYISGTKWGNCGWNSTELTVFIWPFIAVVHGLSLSGLTHHHYHHHQKVSSLEANVNPDSCFNKFFKLSKCFVKTVPILLKELKNFLKESMYVFQQIYI